MVLFIMKVSVKFLINMKKFIICLFSLLILSYNVLAIVGNTNNGSSSDFIGNVINVGRFYASSNMYTSNLIAKVAGSGGKYKCAIYNDNNNLPNLFLGGTDEIIAITNGYYRFPLTRGIQLTNSQYYWFAIWSDNANSRVYYSDASSGTLRWVSSSPYSNTWPNPLVTTAGANYNYCIYADDAILNNPNIISVTLLWSDTNSTKVAGYKVYYGVSSRTYTNSIDFGKVFQGNIEIPNRTGTTFFFTATAYNSFGTESLYSSEVSYSITTNSLGKPYQLRIIF